MMPLKIREECAAEGCDRLADAGDSGYCTLHAARVRRHGNPSQQYRTISKLCAYCGKAFEAKAKFTRDKYCSDTCSRKGEKIWWKNKRQAEQITKTCAWCGNEFQSPVWPYELACCSKSCAAKYSVKKRTSKTQCRHCGKEYYSSSPKHKQCPECTSKKRLDRVHAANKLKRYIKRGARGPSHTQLEWQELCDKYGQKCAYCGVGPIEHKDHVIPISKGGSDSIENIVPSCSACNLSKGAKTLEEWRGYDSRKKAVAY